MRRETHNRSRGFSLIEVLVALFVLSVGMMGVAALFVSSLQYGGSAILRTRAVNFADDMADRIRANAAAGASYVTALTDAGTNSKYCSDTGAAVAAACTEDELAVHDVYLWKQAITGAATGLPGGQGSVAQNTATAARRRIGISSLERLRVARGTPRRAPRR